MSDIAIRVEKMGKRYRIGAEEERYSTLRESATRAFSTPLRWLRRDSGAETSTQVWALKDVSFEVKQGEVLGIIGRNGAGKSTLLKILSRITEPTEGSAEIHGRVGSLLEVGTGFHPELTGRENIYLNGAILGMKRREIESKFDEMVAFAEVARFLDTPVKRYSSGMYMRLAFAVAAHLEPEILLVDEVLAVGDIGFQQKCLGRMSDVAREGRTVLFVSHNMAAISALCTRAMLLAHGQVTQTGTAQEVVESYLDSVRTTASIPLYERRDRGGSGRARLTGLTFRSGNSRQTTDIAMSGEDLEIDVEYASQGEQPLTDVSLSIGVYGPHGQFLLFCGNEMTGVRFECIPPQGHLRCGIPHLPLAPGLYDLNLYCQVNGVVADWIQQAGQITVVEGDFFGTGYLPPSSHGGLLVPQQWSARA